MQLTSDDRFFKYDILAMTWSVVEASASPQMRYLHGSALVGSHMYIFSGWNDEVGGDVGTIHSIDLAAPTQWTQVKTHDPEGLAIRDSYCYASTGSLTYIFAGWSESEGIRNDLIKVDLCMVHAASTPAEVTRLSNVLDYPTRRKLHVLETLGNSLLVFGGSGPNSE